MGNNDGMLKKISEGIVTVMIFLVIIQTLLDELSVILIFDTEWRNMLLFSAFFFDVFFTLEFIVRFYFAGLRKNIKNYIIHGQGWIDFLAAVPLLMFSSGPPLFTYLLGKTAVF